MQTSTLNSNNGSILIEVILAATMVSLLVTTVIGSLIYSQDSNLAAGKRGRGVLLAEEGLEAVRNIRNNQFNSLTSGTYGLQTVNGTWALSGSNDVTEGFTRSVTIAPVNATTTNVTVNVTWQQTPARTGQMSLSTTLSNWMALIATGSWNNPGTGSTLDLPGNANAIDVAVSGDYAYIVRDSGGQNMHVVSITDPANPLVVGSVSVSGNPTAVTVSGNFAYVTSQDNNQELQIINVSDPANPTIEGFYNAAGSANGNGVAVSGTTAFLVRVSSSDPELIAINVSNPASPATLDSLDLGESGNDIVAAGNYVYIASSHNSRELQIVNVSNPTSIQLDGSYNMSGTNNATALTITGSIISISQGNSFYLIDVSTVTAPTLLGSFNAGASINDLAEGQTNGLTFVATTDSQRDVRIVNSADPANPVLLADADLTTTLNALAFHDAKNRAVGVSNSNTTELIILMPQ